MSTSLSGPVLYARQRIFPLFTSIEATQPRTPKSAALLPTSAWPFTMSGAIVIVSPRFTSPSFVFQSCLPVVASTPTVCASSVLYTILFCQNAQPRLITSQHTTPCDCAAGLGSYFHFSAPLFARSSAYRMLGYGVTTYIVLPTTSGAASCPRLMPVEKVHATFSFLTFSAVISFRPLKRVLA